jgi:uncharacterized protein
MQFVNIVKPTHICNLDCSYCYNDDVREPVMREGTLVRMVEQTFDYVRQNPLFGSCSFIWHGGEPMVPGLKFYEKVVAIQEELAGGVKYINSIQTNGTLVNDRWIDFFKKHRFAISISVDGPRHLHDVYRLTHRGTGSYESVMRGVRLAKASGLSFGVCMVLSKATKNHGKAILEFFAEQNLPFNVVPMVKSGAARGRYDEIGLDQHEYADAWIELYDAWLALSDKYVYCQDFVLTTRSILHGQASDCVGLANCSHFNISTDPVGNVYPCSSVSGNDPCLYGNINDHDLSTLLLSEVASHFRNRAVDPHCSTCKWQHVCHGGCASRSYKFYGDIDHRDYYCPSLFRIYEHIEMRLRERGVAAGLRSEHHMSDGVDPAIYAKLRVPVGRKGMARVIPISQS